EKRILCILLAIAFMNTNLLWAADDDRLAELEKKIEAMQTAYESKIDSLESRIVELESKESHLAGVPSDSADFSAPAVSVPTGENAVVLPEPPEEYSIEWMRQYATALNAIQQRQNQQILKEKSEWGFEFHGYLRSGFGINSHGNSMTETTFLSRMPEDILEEGVTFDTQIRLAYVVDFDDSNNSDTDTSLREAFGIVRGVWKDIPQAAFWAGQRFYSRYDVHMNDFYYRDMSGYGGGVEDIPIWNESAQLSVALLGGSTDDLDSSGTQFDEDDYQLNMNTIDVGLSEMDLFGGKVAFYGTFSDFNGDTLTETSSGDLFMTSTSPKLFPTGSYSSTAKGPRPTFVH
ncbi:MAG: carbohydrate porin, partial [Planctomycetota bacterium]